MLAGVLMFGASLTLLGTIALGMDADDRADKIACLFLRDALTGIVVIRNGHAAFVGAPIPLSGLLRGGVELRANRILRFFPVEAQRNPPVLRKGQVEQEEKQARCQRGVNVMRLYLNTGGFLAPA